MCSARVQTQKKEDKRTFSKQKEDESKHVASLLQPPPLMCACSLSISLVGSARNVKKVFFSKMVLAQHSRPHPRHSTCSALASWASSGSVPIGVATIPPIILSLSLCVLTSQSLNLLHCSSRPCPRLTPGGAPRWRCGLCPRPP